jgi:hypothetical protein
VADPSVISAAMTLKAAQPCLRIVHNFRFALSPVADVPLVRRIVFLKSWNEWAEGNHLEPDLRFGRRYIEALHDELRDVPG